ncbi:MAG: hypothetical protein JXP34_23265 [Planctomycetes bacterium]|nr:hypothetical protein [Planctomycetota bacterium]
MKATGVGSSVAPSALPRILTAIIGLALALSFGRAMALEDVSSLVSADRTPAGAGGFSRGDCNQDGQLNIADAVCILDVQFAGRQNTCEDSLDSNDDGQLNIADPVHLLTYLFAKGPQPPDPFGGCGPDPTQDPLGCVQFKGCPAGGDAYLVKLVNTSKTDVLSPLLAVITSMSPAGTRILNADGLYGGKPYFAYTYLLSGGALAGGAETPTRLWSFQSAGGAVSFNVRVYANLDDGAGWLPGDDPIGDDDAAPDREVRRLAPDGVDYDIMTPGFGFRRILHDKTLFHALRGEGRGGTLDTPGLPGIPVYTQFVGLPMNSKVSVKVTEGKGITYPGIQVYPTQYTAEDNDESPPPPFVINEKFYATNQYYPENLLSMGEVEFRGLRLAIVRVALGRVNPRRGELVLYPDLRIQISFDGALNKAPTDYIDASYRTLDTEEILGVTTLNHSIYALAPKAIVADRVRYLFSDVLIIAPRAFDTEAEDLADWKRHMGLKTTVSYTDTIGTTAADIEASIRNQFLIRRISYVILFGDAEYIPPHYRTRHPTAHAYRHIGTDLFYACMGPAGDIVPDLAIGRIPASNTTEAARVVQKIKDYEWSPPFAIDFYRRAAIAAYFQDDDDNGVADRLFAQTSEEIYEFLDGAGYAPERIYRTLAGVDPRWWNDGGAVPAVIRKPGFPWTGSTNDIRNAIHAGSFLVTHRDHGSSSGWSDPSFTSTNVNALTNGSLLPVVLSINCQTGWFDRETDEEGGTTTGECFAENFLLRDGGGAIAVVAATRNSRSWINDEFAKGMIDCVWPAMIPGYPGGGDAEALALAGERRLGWVLNYGKLRALDVYPSQQDGYGGTDNPDNITTYQRLAEIFHLLGDPTLRIRTRAPWLMVATVPRAEAFVNVLPIEFPKEFDGATLALMQGGIVIGQGVVAGTQGTIYLPDDSPLRPDDDTYVVATSENAVPFEQKLPFNTSCTLHCLEVPVSTAGTNYLADLGAPADGTLIPLSSQKLNGTGRQTCCDSTLVGTNAYLFAGHNQSGRIEMMRFGPGGVPIPIAGSPFAGKGVRPSYLAVNDAGDRLLATTADELIEVFVISASGLTPVRGSPYTIDGAARDLDTYTYKLKTFAYVGSMANPKTVYAFELTATGLTPLASYNLEKLGAGRPGARVIATPQGYLFVRDLDAGIFAFQINQATGALSLVKGSPFSAGGFGSAMGVTRGGGFLYAATSAAAGKPEDIACFRIETGGTLTLVGRAESPALIEDITTDCTDGILYAASRTDNVIARYGILKNGTLKVLGETKVGTTGATPAALWAR